MADDVNKLPTLPWGRGKDSMAEAIHELTEAIRFTVEYVGLAMLPPLEGWSWFDVLKKYDPETAAKFLQNYRVASSIMEFEYKTTPKQEIWVLYEMHHRDYIPKLKFATRELAIDGAREAISRLACDMVEGTQEMVPSNIMSWISETEDSDAPIVFYEAYVGSKQILVKIQKEML